jgi:hypothetical protein
MEQFSYLYFYGHYYQICSLYAYPSISFFLFYYSLLLLTANGFYLVGWYYTKTQNKNSARHTKVYTKICMF